MADTSRTPEVQLEAMRISDCSWHPCQVSLSSSGNLVVHFESLDLEDDIQNVEELYARVRVRSIPLDGIDCHHIKEGEHILAASKSNYNSLFIDAVVQEVQLVRHSKRIICRCIFMVKWMQDPDSENVAVPSSLVMKLSSESVTIHPVVAAFLNSMKKTSLSDGSFTISDEPYDEYDFDGAIGKQIEEIGYLAEGVTIELVEDIFRVQPGYGKGSCSKIPSTTNKGNPLRRSNRNTSKTITEKKDHEPVMTLSLQDSAKNISTKEDLAENRSPLNPLAARAALASLVSKFPQKLDFSFYGDEKDVGLESNVTSSLTHVEVRNESVTLNGNVEFENLDRDMNWGDFKSRKPVTLLAEEREETSIHKVVFALRRDTGADHHSSHRKHLLPHAMGSKKKDAFINGELVQKNKKLKISSADQAQKRNEGEVPGKANSSMKEKRTNIIKHPPSRSSPRLSLLPRTRSEAKS